MTEPTKKLYRVKCRGMQGTESPYGDVFVVADDPGRAYSLVRRWLDDNAIGFDKDRELDSVTLLAVSARYPNTHRLMVDGEDDW